MSDIDSAVTGALRQVNLSEVQVVRHYRAYKPQSNGFGRRVEIEVIELVDVSMPDNRYRVIATIQGGNSISSEGGSAEEAIARLNWHEFD